MSSLPERIAYLKKIHLFRGLSDDDLNRLSQTMSDEEYKAGDVIIEQGTRSNKMYIVQSGRVTVKRRNKRVEELLAFLVPYDYFGEEEIVSGRARTATIVALTDVRLMIVHGETLAQVFKKFPKIKLNFDVAISSRQLWRSLRFKWVRPDEVVYFLARKHPIVMWRSLMAPLFSLLLPLFLILWGLFAAANWAISLGIVAILAIGLWSAYLVVDWGNDYYVVTNQRVVWVEKVVGIFDSRTEAPLSTVLSVGMETDALGRILDFGHIIVRTYVGQIPFRFVGHPQYAAHMIEEYWGRAKEVGMTAEKDAMKDAIRKRLGLQPPAKPPAPIPEPIGLPKLRRPSAFQIFWANIFRLRLEDGDTVVYRKHWFVLVEQVWPYTLIILAILILWIARIWSLALNPDEAVIELTNGFTIDSFVLSLPFLMVPFILLWIYQYIDWTNDIFKVTPDQIIDIDKTPFGQEQRRSAPIENILNTESKRVGILGNIFNYGTVYISVGGTQLEFQDVFDPATVQSDIDRRRMLRIAQKNQAAAAADRERMAEWIATYHRSSEEFRKQEQEKNNPKPV